MNLNQAVITTKYIINENRPILLVVHDEDDDWQFLGGQENIENDALVVSLKQIIEYDHSIELLLKMPKNCTAIRKNRKSDWVIKHD